MMRSHRFGVAGLVLVCGLGLTFAGCGGSESSGADKVGKAATPEQQAELDAMTKRMIEQAKHPGKAR